MKYTEALYMTKTAAVNWGKMGQDLKGWATNNWGRLGGGILGTVIMGLLGRRLFGNGAGGVLGGLAGAGLGAYLGSRLQQSEGANKWLKDYGIDLPLEKRPAPAAPTTAPTQPAAPAPAPEPVAAPQPTQPPTVPATK